MRYRLALLLAALLLFVGAGPSQPSVVRAQPGTTDCLLEQEPNDVPEGPLASFSGQGCLAGSLPSADQDLVVWESPADTTARLWSIELDAADDMLTVAELRPISSPAGQSPPVAEGPVVQLRIEPEGPSETTASDVLLKPGRYLVGVTASSPSGTLLPLDLGYTLRFVPGRSLPLPDGALGASGGTERTGAFELGGDAGAGVGVVHWILPDQPTAEQTYRLVLQGYPGAGLILALTDTDGRQLASAGQDASGRAVLDDLALRAGPWIVTAGPPATEPRPYVLIAEAVSGTSLDVEPNDDLASARRLDPSAPVARGVVARADDNDVFHVVLDDDAAAAGSLDIRLVWPSDRSRQLCLLDAAGQTIVCRRSPDDIRLPTLRLAAGDHYLRVSGDAAPDEPYVLRLDQAPAAPEDFEQEPNDVAASATVMGTNMTVRGQAGADDIDHFRVRVTGEPQLWRVDAEGQALSTLDWITPDGTLLGRADVNSDGTRAVLSDMYLIPGEHWLRLVSGGPDYQLRLSALGPPDPAAERESNDAAGREERLLVGQRRHGRLPSLNDTDVYRFHTDANDHVVLTLEPEGSLEVRATVLDGVALSRTSSASAARPLRLDALLPPGDYSVLLNAERASEDGYVIGLERADPFMLADDQEPNDVPSQARPMPLDGVVLGTAGGSSDLDWFELPASQLGEPVAATTEGAVTSVTLWDGSLEQPLTSDGAGGWSALPMSGTGPLYLRVATTGDYRLQLGDAAPPAGSPAPLVSGVRASLTVPDAPPAAWWPDGQRITADLRISNDGDADVSVRLAWASSDLAWSVEAPSDVVMVPAGSDVTVPADVLVPAMVPADAPVRVTAALVSDTAPAAPGQDVVTPRRADIAATSYVEFVPSGDALPTIVERRWSLPVPLLGGLDAASTALGAEPIPSLDAIGEGRLHDGFAAPDWGLSWPIGSLPVALTVNLAGDEAVPVAGVIVHPLSVDPTLGDGPRTFDLALSVDGSTWDVVLSGELVRLAVEQSFVLPEPIPARFAQLRITSVFRMPPTRLELGEWKVIAAPAWPGPGGPLDIAAPAAGGHVVRMVPQPASREDMLSVLDPDLAPHRLAVEAGTDVAWVVGFMEDRAASIGSVVWQDPQPSDPAQRFDRVVISASLASPLGPWWEVGEWHLDRTADGTVSPFQLPGDFTARFLRFEAAVPRKSSAVELPGVMRVLESALGDAGRSVLGQWGMGVRDGPLELAAGPIVPPPDDEVTGHDSAERPRNLEPGGVVRGQVHRDRDRDWFTITVPEGHRSLVSTVSGFPRVGTALVLTDQAGVVRPMDFGPGELPGTVTYRAPVDPGVTYLLEVRQPAASVVVTFDTSASVTPYLAEIEAGLRAFSGGVRRGEEYLRVLPFDERPLLKDWSDDRFEISDAVGRYVVEASSSGAEKNLRRAATDLEGREGDRAILLVTDAASSSFDETADLWSQLEATRPFIVGVEVGGLSEVPAIERHHLSADWAVSAGGFVRAASNGRDIGQSFEALATWLRRPVAYELSLTTSTDDLPEPAPGRITVVAPELDGIRPAVLGEGVALELVLDTSGSMLEPLGGQRRIDIARAVLDELVRQDVPPGVPMALRTFTAEPRSCQTELAIPLAPLEPSVAAGIINGLDVPRSARTPLAAAIAAVAGDLAEVRGPRVVVVVSDGKESCKGDPTDAVRGLRAAGIDVTVNVVGLALDRKSRKVFEALARTGGGSYFDARDPATLGDALRAAVSASFAVLDSDGIEVSRGTIGGAPLEVPPGSYRVVAETEPESTFEDVHVAPGADVELTLVLDRCPSGTPSGRACVSAR